jgi:hypothetical protein
MADSSDEDIGLVVAPSLCSIDSDGLIHSLSSNNFHIKFSANSFVVDCVDNVLVIHMSRMFVWRLIYANKNLSDTEKEFNFKRLKLFVLRLGTELYITNKEVEYNLDGVVHYKPITHIFGLLYSSYSRLYMSIQRGYDQMDVVKHLLDSYVLLLRYISDS